jgi:transcriptional regulator with XRE-family HTH domain
VNKSLNTKEQKLLTEQLYELRIASGLRQQDLADIMSVPQSFVSKIESGERRVDLIELRQICKALNTDIVAFLSSLENKINDSR